MLGDDILVLDTPNNPDIYGPHAHTMMEDARLLLRGCRGNPEVVPSLLRQLGYRVFGESYPRVICLGYRRRGSVFVTRWHHQNGFKNGRAVVVVHQIDAHLY